MGKADNEVMRSILFILLLFMVFLPAGSQETFDYFIPDPERPPMAPEFPEDPPRQFRGLALGMDLEDLKTALTDDTIFSYRGDRDVSWLPIQQETLIETTGMSFIRRAYFQLINDEVYIMSFTLDTRLMDHYSVFTTFVRRYGEPQILNPGESVWENGDTRVSIERPLTVKYIDMTVFNRIMEESRTGESLEILRREEFLGDF